MTGASQPTLNEKPKFALIMPTYDEIDGMHHVWPDIDKSLFHEIIVVDGGSRDGTIEFCEENDITLIMQQGVGMPNALDEGFAHCESDYVVIFSPDGNSLASKLPELCKKMLEGYDMVLVSRYLDGAFSEDDDGVTGPGNWVAVRLVNFLFNTNYTEVLCMYRGYSRNAVEQMQLTKTANENMLRRWFWRMNSWELASVARAARMNLKVGEIPGIEPKRVGGERKMSLVKNGIAVLLQIAHEFVFPWKKNE